jgi:predicted DNA-binding transcriptional regulator AlpA
MFRMLAVLAEITEMTSVSKATLYRRLKESSA